MRIVLVALSLAVSAPVAAAEIVGPYTAGCASAEWYSRVYRMLRAGDRVAAEKFIDASIADGSCIRWPAGLAVRIEEVRMPLACVAPMGSTAPCRWIEAREVKP